MGGSGGQDGCGPPVPTRTASSPKARAPWMSVASWSLGEPAFTATVMLDVAVAPPPCGPETQVKFFDVLVLAQGLRTAVEHDSAVLQNVAIVGHTQSRGRVLLGEQETDAFLLVQTPHNVEDFRDELGRQAHGWLVE